MMMFVFEFEWFVIGCVGVLLVYVFGVNFMFVVSSRVAFRLYYMRSSAYFNIFF